ncbi:MAG: type II toxin-antitoxin system HicB family antitoxin [Chthoniobacter sp.]|nr:type II toxin-antitoxin system HicB family antitoxin [Chthoniobacter sp.]
MNSEILLDAVEMNIRAVIHKAEEGGFWAEVPALPGCATQGETMEELRANLKEAVELWLEAGSLEEPLDAEGQILELVV